MIYDHMKRQDRFLRQSAYDEGFLKGAITGAVCTFVLLVSIIVFSLYIAVRAHGG